MLDRAENEVTWAGSSYKSILTTEETNRAIAIVDSTSAPDVGPPRHVHRQEDEAFVVLSGEVEFWVAGKTFRKGPGEATFIPRNTEHTFRVVSDTPARHLVILTPGGFEGFFFEMAEGNFAIPEDMERINDCATRHNLEFTSPPLSA